LNRLDRYILKAFIGPFVAILLVVVFVLMMQFLWLYIDELVGKGLGFAVVMEFLFWGVCTILPLALPLATLLSSMMVVGQMGENNELMAIKASGVSLARILAPLMISAFIISIAAFFAGNDLVPKAYNEIYTLRDDIGRTKEEIKIPSGTFYDGIDGYIMRVRENGKNGMLYDVMVYDHTNKKGNTSLTLADSAIIRMSAKKDYLIFTMFDGSNYQETNSKHYNDTSLQLQRMDFSKQELVVSLKNYAFEKSDSSRFGDQIKSMPLASLKYQQDSLRGLAVQTRDRHYSSFSHGSHFTYKKQLDTATIVADRNLFPTDRISSWPSLQDKVDAYGQAKEKAEQLTVTVGSWGGESYQYFFYLHRGAVEILKKFAQALACLLLFFIGAPLGALIKKGGLGTSAIVSVLFFVLYWVVDISGTKLARDGAVSAVVGAFISAFVLAPIGAFLSYKAINDSPIFASDTVAGIRRRLFSKIRSLFHPTRIVFMGTPDFAVASLDALVKSRHKVVGVVTVADKPSGRGLQVNESAVKKYALAHGLPVLQPVKLKDPEFLSQLSALKADLFVVVAFRMLPEEVWSMPSMGTFNLHAALLPQYRGAAPINWAVINGEKMTGVTTFMIDKDIDTGGIMLREELRISPEDTAGTVHDRLMEIGARLVVETVEGLEQKSMELRVQRSFIQGSEILKPAPKLTRETCTVDWRESSSRIHNLIRGLSPYPAAFTTLCKGDEVRELKIFLSENTQDYHGDPGSIISDGKSFMAVCCSEGAVLLKEVQLQGKKRMDIKSFLAGFRDPQTYICR